MTRQGIAGVGMLIALVEDGDHDVIRRLRGLHFSCWSGSYGRCTRKSARWIAKFMPGIARTN